MRLVEGCSASDIQDLEERVGHGILKLTRVANQLLLCGFEGGGLNSRGLCSVCGHDEVLNGVVGLLVRSGGTEGSTGFYDLELHADVEGCVTVPLVSFRNGVPWVKLLEAGSKIHSFPLRGEESLVDCSMKRTPSS